MDFQGKTVLVTGASRGIGRACAQEFARLGAQVAIHYNTDLSVAQASLASLVGEGHIILQANLSQPDEAHKLVQEAQAGLGKLDVVVNNAGIFKPHKLTEIDYTEWQNAWQETLAVNLIGPANIMYCAAQVMIAQGGGRIVNVGSRGAFRGEPNAPAYGASKAGLNALSQSLAQALAPHNVFVHVVAPGFVETAMARTHLQGAAGDAIRAQSPLNRVATVQEVAYAVAFAASERAAFMTGAILDVNGASYLRS